MNLLAGQILESLLKVSFQVSILIAFIWIVSLLVKKASAEFRYLLWCIVLVRLCIPFEFNLPLLPELPAFKSEILSNSILPAETKPDINQASTQQSAPMISNNFTAFSLLSTKITSIINKTGLNKVDYRKLLIIAWILGSSLILIITLSRNLKLFRKLNKCPGVERNELIMLVEDLCLRLGIRQKVSIHYMDPSVFSGPVASGIFKPKIFLPPVMADTWSVDNLEPVLLHELAHIKRHDSIINFLQMIVHTVYFFHPLVWLTNHKIHGLREDVCDDMAVRHLEGEKKRYSTSILNVVEILHEKRSYGLTGFGFAEVKSSLGKRIKRILNENYRINQRLSLLSIVGLALIALVGMAAASSHKPEIIGVTNGNKTNNSGKINTATNKTPDSENQTFNTYIKIYIDKRGGYEIDGYIKTDYKNIENILKKMMIATNKSEIMISTDNNTPIKYYSYLTDIAIKCGFDEWSLQKKPLDMEKF